MSIKTELSEKRRKYVQQEEINTAVKLIEDFIIPKFREIAERDPLARKMRIDFNCEDGERFNYHIPGKSFDSPCNNSEVFNEAVSLAEKYDIGAKGDPGKYYVFYIFLTD